MSMEDNGSPSLGFRLDIKQILSEAQHRWLRPAEICEILRNHPKFHISPEPPHKPVSGSVFLFDRKALRYFRKDSHNWRKKRDGKTVKEAHEKLKVGSVDMLHCYYAHGEEDENFQRRSYWLLEQDLMHIVFVHYLEVKGSKTYNSYNRNVESASNTVTFSFPENRNIAASPSTDSTSPTSTLTSAYEDAAESEPNDQANSGFQSPDSSVTAQGHYHMPSYSGDVYIPVMDYASAPYQSSFTHGTQKTVDMTPWEDVFAHSTTGGNVIGQNSIGNSSLIPNNDLSYNNSEKSFFEQKLLSENLQSIVDSYYTDPQVEDEQEGLSNGMKCNYSRILQQSLVSGGSHVEEGLKKVDSFSKWVAKELVDELAIQSNCEISWSALENDICALNPSLSQDQLFSISNISPTWGYSNCETEVRINGTFLKYEQELVNIRWSCMFGEIEVPVEVLKDGILKCYAPRHRDGIFPIYITCSNRSACSEVREFEYRVGPVQDSATIEMNLRNRLEKLLSSSNHPVSFGSIGESKEESVNRVKDMFYSWIFKKVNESEKGAAILDQEGQGVLHLAAALGFNWVFQQVIVSGVSIDFRDVNGWTALHWAAFYGREETVACLVSLGAGPGALTDPTAEFPMGRTPADLASSNGHKGISGFLAESSLTTHLVSLTVNDEKKEEGIQTVSERAPIKITEYDAPDAISLRDSLVAVCNATQAATRIHQIFRIQSFQRKQFISDEDDEEGIPFRGLRNSRFGQVQGSNNGVVHTAATCIQKKYRGWKKRQEFLLIRQRIVKIQAHVRGHQARKKHKPITWSVGILEKIILRWRRKGRGLRGIQQENNNTVANNEEEIATVEDDFDVLKQGRKQSEERLIKALARVKSMSSNPEARAQYRRLLTVAEEIREPKEVSSDMMLQGSEDMSYYPEDELFDVESLFGEDTLMTFF